MGRPFVPAAISGSTDRRCQVLRGILVPHSRVLPAKGGPFFVLQAVLFDFDMTLIDSSDAMLNSFRLLSERFGFPPVTRERLMEFIGLHDEAYWREAIGGISEEILDYYRQVCLPSELPLFRPLDGTVQCLKNLRRRGLATGCATNRRTGDAILRQTGLWDLMDCSIGAGQVPNPKPAPDMLLLAMEKLGASPECTVYVGDTDLDVAAGVAAGVRVVALTTSTDEKTLRRAGAWRVCAAPSELEGLLAGEGLLAPDDGNCRPN